MRRYKKRNYEIFRYDFDTLHQFLSYIQTAPLNERVFSRGSVSSHKTSDNDWSGTKSFAEAVELCRKGWLQDFEKFTRAKRRIDERLLQPRAKPRQILDLVGYNPSIPDYLQGNPLNMWSHTKVQIPTVINIYLNLSYGSKTSYKAIFNRGVIALGLVDALQNRGYSVCLKVLECATSDDEMLLSFFNLKGDGEKLNIRKSYFPLCHPSFLRRLVFRLEEVTPFTNIEWRNGYGCPAGLETIKEAITVGSNDIVIIQPDKMGVGGNNLDKDLEAVLDFTNLKEILVKT